MTCSMANLYGKHDVGAQQSQHLCLPKLSAEDKENQRTHSLRHACCPLPNHQLVVRRPHHKKTQEEISGRSLAFSPKQNNSKKTEKKPGRHACWRQPLNRLRSSPPRCGESPEAAHRERQTSAPCTAERRNTRT